MHHSKYWDSTIEEFSDNIREDAKYKIDKHDIVVWYITSRIPLWNTAYEQVTEQNISECWIKYVSDANINTPFNTFHWLKKTETMLYQISTKVDTVLESGTVANSDLIVMRANIFKKEPKEKVDGIFAICFYMALYTPCRDDVVSLLVKHKKFTRDTLLLIEEYSAQRKKMDLESLQIIMYLLINAF